MPTTLPVNIQQTLQMGTHAEKLQQTLQQQPVILAQQLDEERKKDDELKRSEVQDMEFSDSVNPANPDGPRKKRVRIMKKSSDQDETTQEDVSKDILLHPESPQGSQLDLVV